MTYNGIDFNGTSGGGQALRYWCNFTVNNVWKQQQRFLILCYNTDYHYETLDVSYGAAGSVTYTLPQGSYLILDVTDIIRTYGNMTIGMSMYGEQYEYIAIVVQGLLNPAYMLIPEQRDIEKSAYIVPPRMMYAASAASDLLSVEAEFRPLDPSLRWLWMELSGTPRINRIFPPTIVIGASYLRIRVSDGTTLVFDRFLREGVCDERYAAVRWVSATGATRVHVFALRKHTIEASGGYSLQRVDRALNEVKGRAEYVTLLVDELDAYDYWYYSDILTSSKVEVMINATIGYKPVVITDSSTIIPDGGSLGQLELTAKLNEYDAVAM